VYCEELTHASRKEGINIDVWAPKYAKQENYIRKLPLAGTQDWTCSFRLIREIKNFKFPSNALLHFAESGSLRAIVRLGWTLRELPKFIVTIHGTELIRFCKNPIEKIAFKKILKKAVRIHVLSKFNRDKLVSLCPEITDKILVSPGAPARNLINSEEKTDSVLKNRKLRILCVARIHPRKGQDKVLSAVESLPQDLKKNIKCVFVGPILKKVFYKKLLKQAENLDSEVRFHGDLSDSKLNKVYQTSDIFILPSMPRSNSIEGFGFVYLEASSHGLPVLGHSIGGVNDAVKNNITGILTDYKRPNELKSALKRLVEDENLRIKMGNEGKKWASKHSWSNLANEIYKPTGHQQMQGAID
jgi:glycosyltransferase involved in cell wall biosynthesis